MGLSTKSTKSHTTVAALAAAILILTPANISSQPQPTSIRPSLSSGLGLIPGVGFVVHPNTPTCAHNIAGNIYTAPINKSYRPWGASGDGVLVIDAYYGRYPALAPGRVSCGYVGESYYVNDRVLRRAFEAGALGSLTQYNGVPTEEEKRDLAATVRRGTGFYATWGGGVDPAAPGAVPERARQSNAVGPARLYRGLGAYWEWVGWRPCRGKPQYDAGYPQTLAVLEAYGPEPGCGSLPDSKPPADDDDSGPTLPPDDPHPSPPTPSPPPCCEEATTLAQQTAAAAEESARAAISLASTARFELEIVQGRVEALGRRVLVLESRPAPEPPQEPIPEEPDPGGPQPDPGPSPPQPSPDLNPTIHRISANLPIISPSADTPFPRTALPLPADTTRVVIRGSITVGQMCARVPILYAISDPGTSPAPTHEMDISSVCGIIANGIAGHGQGRTVLYGGDSNGRITNAFGPRNIWVEGATISVELECANGVVSSTVAGSTERMGRVARGVDRYLSIATGLPHFKDCVNRRAPCGWCAASGWRYDLTVEVWR